MTTNLVHHLTAVDDSGPAHNSSSSVRQARGYAEDSSVCAFCYGTGMEVIKGKGARRWRCRTEDRRTKLMEAALIPRRY
jgi:hypothetical protein